MEKNSLQIKIDDLQIENVLLSRIITRNTQIILLIKQIDQLSKQVEELKKT